MRIYSHILGLEIAACKMYWLKNLILHLKRICSKIILIIVILWMSSKRRCSSYKEKKIEGNWIKKMYAFMISFISVRSSEKYRQILTRIKIIDWISRKNLRKQPSSNIIKIQYGEMDQWRVLITVSYIFSIKPSIVREYLNLQWIVLTINSRCSFPKTMISPVTPLRSQIQKDHRS